MRSGMSNLTALGSGYEDVFFELAVFFYFERAVAVNEPSFVVFLVEEHSGKGPGLAVILSFEQEIY